MLQLNFLRRKQPWEPKKLTYDEALADINDSLLPVRAHGIIAMSSLLKLRDSCAIANVDILFAIFLGKVRKWIVFGKIWQILF